MAKMTDSLTKIKITASMVEAGEAALVSAFSDEYVSAGSPGLETAVRRVFRAMLKSADEDYCIGGIEKAVSHRLPARAPQSPATKRAER